MHQEWLSKYELLYEVALVDFELRKSEDISHVFVLRSSFAVVDILTFLMLFDSFFLCFLWHNPHNIAPIFSTARNARLLALYCPLDVAIEYYSVTPNFVTKLD